MLRRLAGLAALAAMLCLCLAARSQITPTILHSFDSPYSNVDGAYPQHGVMQAGEGNFYGVTEYGGRYNAGTLYSVTTAGVFTKLYTFGRFGGSNPIGRLIQGKNGDIYGTTVYGGPYQSGTVFKLKLTGKLTTLHTFNGADGNYAVSGLVQAPDGTIFGTTQQGGAYNQGTVYKIASDGTFTLLFSFTGGADGGQPVGGLCIASDGYLYGESNFGGANNTGAIFRINTSGGETVVHSFDADSGGYNHDGERPQSDLIEGTDHRLYGTAPGGGVNGYGTAFVISLQGGFSVLHAFTNPFTTFSYDGATPLSGLVQASDGDLYGTTDMGGTHHVGTLFKMTTSGKLTTLYNFIPDKHVRTGVSDNPTELYEGSDGDLYGTTIQGGVGGTGMIYKIPLAP